MFVCVELRRCGRRGRVLSDVGATACRYYGTTLEGATAWKSRRRPICRTNLVEGRQCSLEVIRAKKKYNRDSFSSSNSR